MRLPVPEFFKPSFASPAENLACDEALLDYADETSGHPGFLRFFESASYFVVLGYGKKLAEEVHEDRCTARGIPMLRRCTGGGTVLQGPGCFNYSLVLPIDALPGLDTITGANRAIMGRIRGALAGLTQEKVEVQGITDLAIGGLKFSGNAQRRKRRCLLFHGSFLLSFDLPLVSELLREPVQQPEYRAHRDHASFIRNFAGNPIAIREALLREWGADDSAAPEAQDEVLRLTRSLVAAKYSQADWNSRF
jgi:lipoate-protein ligase A